MVESLFEVRRLEEINRKWEKVREFYESKHVKFKARLSDLDIEMLYTKMKLLNRELQDHEDKKRLGLRK